MNRQYCILVYSAHSNACKKLFEYIESLPFDMLSTTGLALCCVDNSEIRKTMERCEVHSVPTLLSKYFNQNQQQLVGDEIYDWIAELAQRMGYKEGIEQTAQVSEEVSDELPSSEPTAQKGNIVAQALSMQKSRDIQIGLNKNTDMNKT